jgi:hypothetical protein
MIDWKRVYEDVDRMDAKAFASKFTEDGRMTSGKMPTLAWRTVVEQGTVGFFKTIKGLRHEFVKTSEHKDTAVLEFPTTYNRLDGKSVTIPAVTIFRLQGNRIQDGRVFYDPSPIYT